MTETSKNKKLEEIAKTLINSGDYRVLRRVPKPSIGRCRSREGARYALIVDTETTGLNPRKDEVIELGYILLEYCDDEIFAVSKFGYELQEPKRPIPVEIQKLTGISSKLLSGKTFNQEIIHDVVVASSIVIAHNASFDRPMCEAAFPALSDKPWACSLADIEWAKYGYESKKLKYLLLESGYFFDGHRALDDCAALLTLLSSTGPDGRSFFKILMESARRPSYAVSVEAPYELRNLVRSAGYRWSSFPDRPGGVWRKNVRVEELEVEKGFLSGIANRGVSHSIVEEDAYSRFRIK